MSSRLFILGWLVLLAGLIACANGAPESPPLELTFAFCQGAQDWEAGFAEYSPGMDMQLETGIRPLPSELETGCTGYYLKGMNRSDDLFMFLRRRLGSEEGIVPGQRYRIEFTIIFASNAPNGAVGIGGAPGESVFLKAGASATGPEAHLDPATGCYLMNVDKGLGNSGGGDAASLIGHIANGLSADEIDMANPPYVSLQRSHVHTHVVAASPTGELWLLVGTDSGFEGLTGIYYQSIAVTLEPVE